MSTPSTGSICAGKKRLQEEEASRRRGFKKKTAGPEF
jgi:hypothetical protein